MSDSSARLSELSLDDKRELLVKLLKQEAAAGAESLSVAQRRYWVLRQMEPTVPTHVVAAVEVAGDLDVGLLQASECRNTLAGTADAGLRMTQIDEKFIHDCLTFLVETGYLKPPTTASGPAASATAGRTPAIAGARP